MKISKVEFERYEGVRALGATNMCNVRNVEALSGLSREKILTIMKEYKELEAEFGTPSEVGK